MTTLEERRNWLRFQLLVALADAPSERLPLDYRSAVAGVDDFE